ADWFNGNRPKQEPETPEVERGPPSGNPKPWETVVRIIITGPRSKGYGSGTIIHSTDREAIVLTCAHIFHLGGLRKQPSPANFPPRSQVDLFDGNVGGPNKQQVKFLRSLAGHAIDYEFGLDVGLIRVETEGPLPFSPVVPESWEPQPKMRVLAAGSPEGKNA